MLTRAPRPPGAGELALLCGRIPGRA